MKINGPVIHPLQVKQAPKSISDKTEKTDSFESVFNAALSNKHECAKTEIKSHPIDITQVNLSVGADKAENKADLMQRMEMCLNSLEEYSFKLADPGIPLNVLNQSIHELKTQTGNLSLESDPFKNDEGLQGILTDLLEGITAEIKQFEQGDYVGWQ